MPFELDLALRLGPVGLAQDTIRLGLAAKIENALTRPLSGPRQGTMSEAARPESNGGGAGSCTRVRKYILAGIYDA